MEQLLNLFFGGGLGLLKGAPGILELDRELPKSELFALLILSRRGTATMSELASDLGAPLSTATGIASRLMKRQLIARERDATDRRIILVQLTPKGQQLAKKLWAEINHLISRVQTALSAQEITQLISIVQKVLNAFSTGAAANQTEDKGPSARQIPIVD